MTLAAATVDDLVGGARPRLIDSRLFVALIVMALVTSLIAGPAMARLLRSPPKRTRPGASAA